MTHTWCQILKWIKNVSRKQKQILTCLDLVINSEIATLIRADMADLSCQSYPCFVLWDIPHIEMCWIDHMGYHHPLEQCWITKKKLFCSFMVHTILEKETFQFGSYNSNYIYRLLLSMWSSLSTKAQKSQECYYVLSPLHSWIILGSNYKMFRSVSNQGSCDCGFHCKICNLEGMQTSLSSRKNYIVLWTKGFMVPWHKNASDQWCLSTDLSRGKKKSIGSVTTVFSVSVPSTIVR